MKTGLYLTDTHDMGRNPGARIDDYHAAIMRKMREAIETAIANDVDFIVHGGDWFHTPRVAYSLYNQHQRLLRRARKKGIKVYLVPGNHDLYGYSMDTIDQTAIGALAQSGLVTLLTSKKHVEIDDPDFKLVLHGKEYHKDIDKDPKMDYFVDKKGDHDILFSHGMLLKKPFHPDVSYSLTKDIVTHADVVLNGHYHPGYPLHEVNGTMFGNPGSTGRDEGSVDSMKRIPQYAMITVDKKGIDVEYVEYVVAKPGKDVFDRTQLVQKKEHTRYLDAFEQTIEDALAFDAFDPKDILNKTKGLDSTLLSKAMKAIVDQEKKVHDGKLDGYIEKAQALGISSIELINFQSHKKTVVKLNAKGLNALTGSSDSGKSAVIRALRWVLYNDPKGTDFIRHGATRTTVTVIFTDGSSITRSRTKSSAGEYIVRDTNGKETEFKGFGTTIPIDVANTHQMPKVELSTGIERPINFSYQLDGHFLLSESPAVRANTIGRLTGVHVVDAAIKETAKEIRQYTIATNSVEKQIEELDTVLAGYTTLDDTEKRLNILKGTIKVAENLDIEIEELERLSKDYDVSTANVRDIKDDLKAYKNVDRGLLLVNQAEQLSREIVELTSLKKEHKALKNTITEIKMDLTDYEDIDNGLDLISQAETILDELDELKSLSKQLEKYTKDVKILESKMDVYKFVYKVDIEEMERIQMEIQELRSLQEAFDSTRIETRLIEHDLESAELATARIEQQIVKLFEQMDNKCPTCHQVVLGAAVDDIIAHVG